MRFKREEHNKPTWNGTSLTYSDPYWGGLICMWNLTRVLGHQKCIWRKKRVTLYSICVCCVSYENQSLKLGKCFELDLKIVRNYGFNLCVCGSLRGLTNAYKPLFRHSLSLFEWISLCVCVSLFPIFNLTLGGCVWWFWWS